MARFVSWFEFDELKIYKFVIKTNIDGLKKIKSNQPANSTQSYRLI